MKQGSAMTIGRWVQVLLVFLLQSLVATVLAQRGAPCPISTLSGEIGGGRIVYNVAGAGPNVLLLHGLFADKEQWDALACMLVSNGYRTIAVDLPGYGKSDGYPLADYRLENQVSMLHTLMERLHVQQFDLAGNSMGGAISSLYAGRYPEQVSSVAFIGSPLGITSWSQPIRDAIYRGINPFIPINESQLDIELRLLFVVPPVISDSEKQRIVARYVSNNHHYVQAWNIVNTYDDILARRKLPQLPTLIVLGVDDRIYNVVGAQILQRLISGSELHRLPHAGHLLHIENAPEVAPIYVNFLRSRAGLAAAPGK
jgi:abhydrolase domain-containing protein 6